MKMYRLASEVSEAVRMGELSAEDHIGRIHEVIDRREQDVHAYITVLKELSLSRAREIDLRVKRGEKVGRLAGVAVAVKDNICMKNVRTTCGSRMLSNYTAPYNATVIEKLLAEDAVIIGKTNMDEFAMGSTTELSYFGPTRNPHDYSKVAGGSSGGSAAAVAADEATVALGSDTGGSIRCPAAFCSVVGLKPTYGLVSRYGLISYANSLEQIGPIAKDVRDASLLLSCTAGKDPFDATSIDKGFKDDVKPLAGSRPRIGAIKEMMSNSADKDVLRAADAALERYREEGAMVDEVSLGPLDAALAAYYVIATSEASSNLARYDGLKFGFSIRDSSRSWREVVMDNRAAGFGDEVKRRILLGTYALSEGYFDMYYVRAQRIRGMLGQHFRSLFRDHDLLLGPTMPMKPFGIGEKVTDQLQLFLCDVNTIPANLAGIPAISVPYPPHNTMGIGVQLMAPAFHEDTLLAAARILEN